MFCLSCGCGLDEMFDGVVGVLGLIGVCCVCRCVEVLIRDGGGRFWWP